MTRKFAPDCFAASQDEARTRRTPAEGGRRYTSPHSHPVSVTVARGLSTRVARSMITVNAGVPVEWTRGEGAVLRGLRTSHGAAGLPRHPER